MNTFSLKFPGNIIFGDNSVNKLGTITAMRMKNRAVVFTNGRLMDCSGIKDIIIEQFKDAGIDYTIVEINMPVNEGSFNEVMKILRNFKPDIFVAVGEDDVINFAKAARILFENEIEISELIKFQNKNHYDSNTLPLVVVTTMSGSGNAVSDELIIKGMLTDKYCGPLKNDIFIPECAIIDPLLIKFATPQDILYCGFDIFSRLIESYVSKNANLFTDALMLQGLKLIAEALPVLVNNPNDQSALNSYAYASLLAGIGSANSRLTLIHGLTYAVCSKYCDIPHGAVCGAIMFAATLLNMQRVQMFDPTSTATKKYAKIGSLFCGIDESFDKHGVLLRGVTEYLKEFTQKLKAPRLSRLGVDKEDFYSIVSVTNPYGNPVDLAETEIIDILEMSY